MGPPSLAIWVMNLQMGAHSFCLCLLHKLKKKKCFRADLAEGGDSTLGGERRCWEVSEGDGTGQSSRRETRSWPGAVWCGAGIGLPICSTSTWDAISPKEFSAWEFGGLVHQRGAASCCFSAPSLGFAPWILHQNTAQHQMGSPAHRQHSQHHSCPHLPGTDGWRARGSWA